MSVRERVLTIRLLEKAEKHAEYMKRLGMETTRFKIESEQNKGRGTKPWSSR